MMKKKLPAIFSILAIVGAVVYLLVSGFDDTVVYYKTVPELLADPGRFASRPVRINGLLVAGSLRAKPGTNEFRFQLSKRDAKLDVSYEGVLPDTMQEGQELVVHGVYDSGSKTFRAQEILTKCPSKYEAQAKAAN